MAKTIPNTTEELPPWKERIIGRGTSEWVVRRADCPAFDAYDLVEIGHIEAAPSYRVVRERWPFVVVLLGVGGLGTIRSGRQSWRLGSGQALLLPPDSPHEMESSKAGWSCTILNYRPDGLVSHNLKSPRLISIHAQALEALIVAFRAEYQSDKDPVLMRQMLDIVQAKTMRLFNPTQSAGRLWPLWSEVLEHPEFNWTIETLSQRAHLSGEHLRRICLNEAKRSPMAQVTWLRLKAAASRLAVGNEIIEEIAHQVGFESERAFRSAFTKSFQCSPSEYRQNHRQSFEALNDAANSTERAGTRSYGEKALAEIADYDLPDSHPPFTSLSLEEVANAFFSRGKKPWFGDVPLIFPAHGKQRIHGIPFVILDEKRGPSFLLLRSAHLTVDEQGRPLPQRVRLPVKRRVQAIYFLHACGWGSEFGAFARYRIIYSDKTVVEQPLVVLAGAHAEEIDGSQANMQDWYFSWDQLARDKAKPYDATPQSNPLLSSQYLYTLEWANPSPAKQVSFLEIVSDLKSEATLAVLGITLV